jgi:hypothetical protein
MSHFGFAIAIQYEHMSLDVIKIYPFEKLAKKKDAILNPGMLLWTLGQSL